MYYTIGFLEGYASNNNHEVESLWLYLKFAAAHLVINIFILEFLLKDLNFKNILISSLEILVLYGIAALI